MLGQCHAGLLSSSSPLSMPLPAGSATPRVLGCPYHPRVLVELHLRDLGVIGQASVELSPGLNVVTGETGVGKTLLVSSLGLLTGARGHARLVREGASEAVVQAVVVPTPAVRAVLADQGGGDDEDLVLVRRVSSDGRSRAWIAGQLAPVSMLADLGESLVELHGQGAGFALARPNAQLAAVDALAGNADVLEAYRTALAVLRGLERDRDALAAGEATREREIELLTHQAEEIERAALEEGEEDAVAVALSRLEHAERLGTVGSEVGALAGAEGAAGALTEAHKTMQTAAAVDPDAAALATRLGALAAEASELGRDVRVWADTLDGDPGQLDALRERKALLAALKRKYGTTVADVIVAGVDARRRLDELTSADERIAVVDGEIADARATVERAAAELTKRRRKACTRLTDLVGAELPALALPSAMFEVKHEQTEMTESGADAVEFLFSSSRSTTPDGIGRIASGGELSRVMIAITLALAQTHAVPVLVFDEADQGIAGEAALELGRRLARLGRTHQVLVVSHLPQIAAFADRHIAVRRTADDVKVEVLDPAGRLAEVSRMLAGLESSELARAHAGELLALAQDERAGDATSVRAG
jgi:DNA repair protein RecN (Recombination protein N)